MQPICFSHCYRDYYNKISVLSRGLSTAATLMMPQLAEFSPNSYCYYTATNIQWYMAGTKAP